MTRWRPWATTIVCVAGLGLAGFLTWGHYFDQAAITNTCPLGGSSGLVNCGAVTQSPESVIFHIPVALYGLVFFVVMTALCLPAMWRSPSMWIARARVALNVIGMAFVLYLVGVEFLEVHHICLYCTGVHILQFALFLLVLTGWNDTGYAQSLWAGDSGDYDEVEAEASDADVSPVTPAAHSVPVSR